ncbi:MAG TPA: Bax inhibitor-1/YccA family protein, partial [Parachlamydiaceae bacterium]|nr:Bax inhibitor-1/YccA family protein [Parachlamydiaceae bacterium]
MDMRSSNPALPANTFNSLRSTADRSDAMTVQGTIYKTLLLLMLVMLSAGWTWTKFYQSGDNGVIATPWVTIGALGGFVMALVTVFKKEWAPITAPIYALLQGLFIGGISAQLETVYPGIVIQAAGLTFGTLFAMLLAYQSGLIRATEKFKMGVVAA